MQARQCRWEARQERRQRSPDSAQGTVISQSCLSGCHCLPSQGSRRLPQGNSQPPIPPAGRNPDNSVPCCPQCHAARSAMLPAVPACSICWQVPRYHGNAVKVQITFSSIPISAAALFFPPTQYFISHASAAEAAGKGLGRCSAIRAVVTLHEVLAQE